MRASQIVEEICVRGESRVEKSGSIFCRLLSPPSLHEVRIVVVAVERLQLMLDLMWCTFMQVEALSPGLLGRPPSHTAKYDFASNYCQGAR